jgi:hypothetical protein
MGRAELCVVSSERMAVNDTKDVQDRGIEGQRMAESSFQSGQKFQRKPPDTIPSDSIVLR